MQKRLICKHLNDADRLEIIQITRVSTEYIYYLCPICRVEGRIKLPGYFNKWEFWRFLRVLRDESKHSGSSGNKNFWENVIKICEHLYDNSPSDTFEFTSVLESAVSDEDLSSK